MNWTVIAGVIALVNCVLSGILGDVGETIAWACATMAWGAVYLRGESND